MVSESKYWIADDYQLKDGSFLGIVSFSSSYNLEHPLTQITNNPSSRDQQRNSITDLTAGGGTEIGSALIYSAQVRIRGG